MVSFETKLSGVSAPALSRFLKRARQAAGLPGDVHVLVVSSRRMRTLNWQFRGQDKATDVLSFPAVPAVARDFAGDIVISAGIAAANARRLRHALAEELKVLVLHGVLHLAGHDHEKDQGQMARREQHLRRKLKLQDGLIERNLASENRTLGPGHGRSRRPR